MRRTITALAMSALCLSASPAMAGDWAKAWQLKDTNSLLKNVQKKTEDVHNEVRESADRIIEALRGATGENSSYADKQIEAVRRITDAAQLNDTTRLRQEFRAEAESGKFDPSPAVCLLAGLWGDGSETGMGDTRMGSTMASGSAARSSGADPAVQSGGTALAKSIVDDRTTYAGLMGRSDPTTDVSVILEDPTLPAESDEDVAAIQRLVNNMIDPLPPRPVTTQELRTPEGQSRAAASTARETKLSGARESVAMVMNMRTAVGPSSGEWESYVEDIANYNRLSGELPEEISELQGLDIRTLRFYAPSAERVIERDNASDTQLLAELLDAVAIGNRVAYLQLELDSRRAVVEAQTLAAIVTGN